MDTEDKEILDGFYSTWPKIISGILEDPKLQDISNSLVWLKEVLQKNVPFGKKNRALLGIRVFRFLKPDREEEDEFLSYVLGWCAEIMQACCLIADDMMDGSTTRRGLPCWYTVDGVGLNAINDAFMLENVVYYLLDKHFSQKKEYPKILRHIQLTSFQTILGQSLDSRLCLQEDLDGFTEETYEVMVKYKTSYYSFYSPIACAMLQAGIQDEKLYQQVEDLVIWIGYLFQVQDDFLDCFGDPDITGKVGTDIRDKKCCWLIIKALQEASDEQRQILKKCYGGKLDSDEVEIRQVYEELEIKRLFLKHEDESYTKTKKMIKSLPPEFPSKPIMKLLNSIYRRQK